MAMTTRVPYNRIDTEHTAGSIWVVKRKRRDFAHLGDVLEGEIRVVDVLLYFGHQGVRHVVLVESFDLR